MRQMFFFFYIWIFILQNSDKRLKKSAQSFFSLHLRTKVKRI